MCWLNNYNDKRNVTRWFPSQILHYIIRRNGMIRLSNDFVCWVYMLYSLRLGMDAFYVFVGGIDATSPIIKIFKMCYSIRMVHSITSQCQYATLMRIMAFTYAAWPLGTNFSEISIGIQTFSFKKMHLKMASAKWRPSCLGLTVLNDL